MGGLKNKSFFLFLAFMLMITTFLPIFSSHMRFNIGVFKYWAILWFICAIWFVPHTVINKNFLYAFFYWIILLIILFNTLWVDVDEWNKRQARGEVLAFLLPISLYAYFKFSRDFDGLALLVKWTLFFIAITAVLSIYSSTIDPLYARNLTGGTYTEDEMTAIQKLGGGAYGFAGALVFLFPMIVYYYRNNSKIPFSKLQILMFGILCFVALIKIQIFANIIVAVIAIVFSLVGSKRIMKSLIYVSIFLGLVVLIPKDFYSGLLIGASRYFNPDSDVYYKLNDMGTFVGSTGVETSARDRVGRYPMLWQGFKAGPFLGVYKSNKGLYAGEGAHLYWMNKLTVYGILGFIPFILIFYFQIKEHIKQFDPGFHYYYLLSVFSGLGLGIMKNLIGTEFWVMFFFIVPSLYYLPLLKKKSSEILSENRHLPN